MKRERIAMFGSGVLFALGLGVSGMTDANKVISFLDVGGAWDPALGFVMLGAVATYAFASRVVLRRAEPLFAQQFATPDRARIDTPLFLGAALFGVGWALGGFCPGPAIASTAGFEPDALIFTVAMVAAIAAWTRFRRRPQSASDHPTSFR